MNKKKYIILTSMGYFPEYGGVENSIRFLSKELSLEGFRPIVITSQSKKVAYRKLSLIDGVIVVRFKFRPFSSSFFNILFMPYSIVSLYFILRRIEKKRNIVKSINRNQFLTFFSQLVFKNNVYLAPGFSQYQATPAMLRTSMSRWQRKVTQFKLSIHQWFDRRALLKSDRVFLFSKNMREQARDVLGPQAALVDTFEITKPGIDSDIFYPASCAEKLSLRKKLKLPINKKIVLSVGRFVSAKGFEYLAESAKELANNIVVVIVGDGPERDYLKEKHSDLIQSGKLILPGKSDDTSSFYKASDIFVLSSVYEPLGQTLLEAGASGLPIISFRESSCVINATEEIFSETAFYVDEVSACSLAEKIEYCLSLTSEEQSEISSSVKSRVLGSCSWRELARDLVDFN